MSQLRPSHSPRQVLEERGTAERQRAGSTVHATEEQLRMMVEGVKDYAIFMLDPQGYVQTWNLGAALINGYRADEIIGRHLSTFYSPEDIEQRKPQRELEVAAREGKFEEEGWRVRKDGSRFWASVVVTALRSPEGALRGFAKVTRDLTERQRAADVLRTSEETFRTMVDAVKDYAIFMLDPQGYVRSWNRGAERIKGYRPDDIIGRHFSTFYTEEDLRDEKPARELRIAIAEGKYEEEGWRLRKDGSRFWANVLITAVYDTTGALAGFTKVTRDVTERREGERVRSIVENVVDGIITVGENAIIDSFNPAAERIFGHASSALLGESFKLLLQDPGEWDDWMHNYGAAPHMRATRGRRADGTTFEMELTLGEFHWLGRRAFTVVARDVTERRRAEQQLQFFARELEKRNLDLQRSNQELDDFAYIASHDLKEPLRGIHNYASFLIEDYAALLDADGKAKLETLARLAQRMERLIDSLLEFSRVGRVDLATQETDLNEVLRQALLSLQITLQHEGVEVRVPAPLPRIKGDRVRLAEVFQNLIANGIKYNDSTNKQVEIGAEIIAGETVLYVRDNGIGVPKKHQEAIFRIFKRMHGRDKYGGGTGVGLTIVKKIIERHGGRIWLESAPGQGTTFYFTLGQAEPTS